MIEESTAPNQPRVDAVTKWLVRELSHISQDALTTNGPFRLKALSRALADGDPIYAVIRGTSVNNDGAGNGLTAPNPQAQESVLREACARAGIQTAHVQASAFGWGGTNCLVVVEEAHRSTAHLLPLSAPDSASLKATAEKLRTYLNSTSPEPALRDICATAASRCVAQPERFALTARSMSELSAQLEGFLLGQKRPGIAVGHTKPTRPKLVFVFSPQGSQWLGMGKNLMAVEPVFRAKLAECDRALTKIAGWSLFDELLAAPADSRLNRAQFVQPALSAMQIALAELWSSWGIRPDFVAAHSLGEWAAAYVAGSLNVEETMRVVVESSRAQAQAGEGGGMAVVELAEAEVKERIQAWSDEVFVAGGNSPTATILSGDAVRLKYLVTAWKEEGLKCSLIDVDVAAHSPRMDLALEELKAKLSTLRPVRTSIPFVSSVTGEYLRGTEMGPEHWAQHIRQPVLFTQVIERLARDGCSSSWR